jgi:hypothetical protein
LDTFVNIINFTTLFFGSDAAENPGPFTIHFNNLYLLKGRRSRDRVVVGFTTTYVISVYHHLC